MKKYVGYTRLSKKKARGNQYGLRSQKRDIEEYISANGGELLELFSEIETGSDRIVRPVLEEALRLCKAEGAVLIIAKLDRLTRSVPFLSTLQKSKVDFFCLDFPDASPLVLNIMVSVAEFEVQRIRERIKKGLQQAKREGQVLGASPDTIQKAVKASVEVRKTNAEEFRKSIRREISHIRTSSKKRLNNQAIADRLNRKKIGTRRGGIWYAESVRRVLAYHG